MSKSDFWGSVKRQKAEKRQKSDLNRLGCLFQTVKDKHSAGAKGVPVLWGGRGDGMTVMFAAIWSWDRLSFLDLSTSSKIARGGKFNCANTSLWADWARSFAGILSCDWRPSIEEKLVAKPMSKPKENQPAPTERPRMICPTAVRKLWLRRKGSLLQPRLWPAVSSCIWNKMKEKQSHLPASSF